MSDPAKGGPEGPELQLPDVHRGELDADGVRGLFADIGALPGPVEVRLKAAAERYADTGDIGLQRARDLLLDGLCLGVQLTYRHDGQLWLDTVMRRGEGFIIVRVASDEPCRPS